MKDNILEIFKNVRDIPYNIPLSFEEEDRCCSGKSKMLLEAFKENGYSVRYRVCVFLWGDLNLPKEVRQVPHDSDCTHTYVEIFLNKKWVIVDATWDKGISKEFKINEWDGKSNTQIGVKPIKIFSPKKSAEIVSNQTREVIDDDLKRNKVFYKIFNEWLERLRKFR